jgi:hypothetical protein
MKPIVLLGDTGKKEFVAKMKELGWGMMLTERIPKRLAYDGMQYAFDNMCFGAWRNETEWDAAAWHIRAMQLRMRGFPPPLFAVVPDLPAKGQESLEFSAKHLELVPQEFPKALALQDGMTYQSVKPYLKDYEYLFIGGSDAFKLHAADWTKFARDHGKKIHYARASTLEKLEWALHLEVDSLDSTFPIVDSSTLSPIHGHFCQRTSQLCPVSKVTG